MHGLYDLLDEAVTSHPDHPALRNADRELTYRDLDSAVQTAATAFESQGVGDGDVIVLWAENTVEAVIALLGLARAGAVIAPVNTTATDNEVRLLLETLRPDGFIAVEAAPASLTDDSLLTRVELHYETPGRPPRLAASRSLHDTALLLATAGSTGAPKVVRLSNRNIAASVDGIRRTYRLTRTDCLLLVMPITHGHGLIGGLLSTLASGGTVALPSTGRFTAHTFAAELRQSGATWYTASPTMHRIILLHQADGGLPKLRFVRSCSEAMPQSLAAQLSDAFETPVLPAYGMTEAAHQVASNPLPTDGDVDVRTVGRPSVDAVSIRAADGTTVPAGVTGEIWLSGPTVSSGYRDDPEATATVFVGRWMRTGDLGSLDDRGYLTIAGRLKDIINRGGEKVSPAEVESALARTPSICEAVAFGVPDPVYGEHVEAVVTLEPGSSFDELGILGELRRVLPTAAMPERVHVMARLPLTAKGTVDRRALSARFASEERENT
jgi:oxalate---CoA ligase